MQLEHSYRLVTSQPSKHHSTRHYSRVCGGGNRPTALPVIQHIRYEQCKILERDNKRLCYWYIHLLYCTLYRYFRVYAFYLQKHICCKTVVMLHWQQPHISRVYFVSWLHHFFCAWCNLMLFCTVTCGWGAIGWTAQLRCAVGYAV